MRLALISDTHNEHKNLIIPKCDVLCISGDYTNIGATREFNDFYDWLESLTQANHKVFIEGNHDLMADRLPGIKQFPKTASYKDWQANLEYRKENFKQHNIHRLFNSEVVIDGVKFWGSPYTLAFYNWAFNMNSEQLRINWTEMPPDVDVLLTHGPPHEKLDLCPDGKRAGDPWLNQKILEVKPKIHVFGHIHEQEPCTMFMGLNNETELINAAVVNDDYSMNLVYPITRTI